MNNKLPLEDLNASESGSLHYQEDNILRPKSLGEYIGQEAAKSRLEIFILAAKKRQASLDHVLLSGPPGLGKTTLAHIVAKEMGGQLHQASGPSLERSVDLLALLSNLQKGDVLFVDEIHRLNAVVEESLYPAMEDNKVQVILGEGASAQSVVLPVQPFTLIGATTQAGKLTGPLRDRFGIQLNLDFYNEEEMHEILLRSASILEINLSAEEIRKVALRSRGTPRIANRLLARVRDYVEVMNETSSSEKLSKSAFKYLKKAQSIQKDSSLVIQALDFLEVDHEGLQPLDRNYLRVLAKRFQGGPAGIEAIAASLSEDRRTLEEMVEPYLLKKGFIVRTPRGRQLRPQSYQHLGLQELLSARPQQEELLT